MKVLVIGRGGRESAIVKKVLASRFVKKVYCAPGNAQTHMLAHNIDIDELDNNSLVKFAKDNKVDLTIVGPESSLENGVVNIFKKENLKIFGPTKEATIIESSKVYAKELMVKYNIPSATYKKFNNSKEAIDYAKSINYPHVIKYDGLAAGKGVIICQDFVQMQREIINMLDDKSFGDKSQIIMEEFLEGEEFTLLSLVNQTKVYPLEVSRDYKKALNNDQGLNTGGMGAVCPFDKIDVKAKEQALKILEETAKALVKEDREFCGVLYGGFINTANGVKVIEYNARFGDPETEVVLQKLESDLVEQILNVINHKEVVLTFNSDYFVGITLAAKGYPEAYSKGFEIIPLEKEGVFHMGTIYDKGKVIASGGRVLFVSSKGKSLEEARNNTYNLVEEYKNDSMFYRIDIGK